MEAVGNVAVGSEANHLLHHIAATCHHKAYVVSLGKHARSSLHEVFRSLLHSDTSEECHHLVLTLLHLDAANLLAQGLHCIVHGSHLVGVDSIFLNHSLASEVAHGDDVVGIVHTVLLNCEHRGVHIAAAAVEVGGVHVYHQRLACHLLGMDTGRISEPVVRVYHIEIDSACNHTCHYRIVIDLLEQVVGIAARKLNAAEIVGAHVVEVGIDMVAQVEVELRIHHIAYAALHIVVAYVAPCHWHTVCAHYAGKAALFVTPWLRNDKSDVHVAIVIHTLCEAVARCAQSTKDMRWELPPEH